MMKDVRKGTCHCGAVEFEVTLPQGLQDLVRCNCSLCKRKGTVMALVLRDNIKILHGENKLKLYQWNTMIAKHYFCGICGIYAHHQRRSAPTECGFNIACLEDVDPYAFKDLRIVDGASLSRVDDKAR
jgi:hypothetical protein